MAPGCTVRRAPAVEKPRIHSHRSCVIGLLISRVLTALLLGLVPKLPVPLSVDISTDWRVLAFTTAVSLVAAVVSGLAPALQASRADLVPALKAEGRGTGPVRLRLRNTFVVRQTGRARTRSAGRFRSTAQTLRRRP
jgi:hypothetical protein